MHRASQELPALRATLSGGRSASKRQTNPAPNPAHRSRKSNRIVAPCIGRRAQARDLPGGSDRFKIIERTGQPCG